MLGSLVGRGAELERIRALLVTDEGPAALVLLGDPGVGKSRLLDAFDDQAAPTELLATFREYYGPTMNAFAAAAADGRTDQLQQELEALFTSENTSLDPDTTSIPAT